MFIGIWVFQTVSCGDSSEADELEQTLQAIYAEDTAQALAAPRREVEVEAAATEAPADAPPEPEKEPLLMPGEPPNPDRILEDSDSSIRASEHRVLSGDNFLKITLKGLSPRRK